MNINPLYILTLTNIKIARYMCLSVMDSTERYSIFLQLVKINITLQKSKFWQNVAIL